MPREYITKRGLEKLRNELEELIRKRRPKVSEKLRIALDFGDIAENPEYAEAKEEQAFVEGRIAEIEYILRNALLVNDTNRKTSLSATIGCAVELAMGNRTRKFFLVGKGEGDPLRGEISSDSPLGQALLGKNAGDQVRISTPSGSKRYKIIKIA